MTMNAGLAFHEYKAVRRLQPTSVNSQPPVRNVEKNCSRDVVYKHCGSNLERACL